MEEEQDAGEHEDGGGAVDGLEGEARRVGDDADQPVRREPLRIRPEHGLVDEARALPARSAR